MWLAVAERGTFPTSRSIIRYYFTKSTNRPRRRKSPLSLVANQRRGFREIRHCDWLSPEVEQFQPSRSISYFPYKYSLVFDKINRVILNIFCTCCNLSLGVLHSFQVDSSGTRRISLNYPELHNGEFSVAAAIQSLKIYKISLQNLVNTIGMTFLF